MSSQRVALITGGASGMGFAVAQELANRRGWTVHIIDLNEKAGEKAAAKLTGSIFHKCDILNYAELGNTFKTVFKHANRLDFVFANAGIHEMGTSGDFYAKHDTGLEPPPEPKDKIRVVDIDLSSLVSSCYLAQHYFRQNKDYLTMDCNLVITASCGSFYKSNNAPVYTAAKHGAVGFMRSIAPKMYANDKIRVNAICPGAVITGLFSDELWSSFPEHLRVPMPLVVETVLTLINGKVKEGVDEEKLRVDGPKKEKDGEPFWGEALEITPASFYFREASKFADALSEENMTAANAE